MKGGVSPRQTLRMLAERLLDASPGADWLHDWMGRSARPSYLAVVRGAMVAWKLDRWRFLLGLRAALLREAAVLDLGTGWTGHDLMLIHLLGARSIDTFDRVAHLRPDCVAAAREGLRDRLAELEGLGAREPRARLKAIPTDDVNAFLAHIGATQHVGRGLDTFDRPAGSYDLFFSYSTLQCLHVEAMRRTMAAARRLLRPGGLSFHDVRFVDNYYSGGGSPLGYLAWPDPVWQALQSRFNYHNRLRHAEFVRLVEDAGFTLLKEQTVLLPPEVVKATPLHRRFAAVPFEDLRVANASMAFVVPD